MTPLVSRSDVETTGLYTNYKHSIAEESRRIDAPRVSRNANGRETPSHFWPAWQNYSSNGIHGKTFMVSQNSAFKNYVSTSPGTVDSGTTKDKSFDVAEVLTSLWHEGV